CMQALYFPLTF
nr:immunoglobulin light chain junction region [Macaca mulatta]